MPIPTAFWRFAIVYTTSFIAGGVLAYFAPKLYSFMVEQCVWGIDEKEEEDCSSTPAPVLPFPSEKKNAIGRTVENVQEQTALVAAMEVESSSPEEQHYVYDQPAITIEELRASMTKKGNVPVLQSVQQIDYGGYFDVEDYHYHMIKNKINPVPSTSRGDASSEEFARAFAEQRKQAVLHNISRGARSVRTLDRTTSSRPELQTPIFAQVFPYTTSRKDASISCEQMRPASPQSIKKGDVEATAREEHGDQLFSTPVCKDQRMRRSNALENSDLFSFLLFADRKEAEWCVCADTRRQETVMTLRPDGRMCEKDVHQHRRQKRRAYEKGLAQAKTKEEKELFLENMQLFGRVAGLAGLLKFEASRKRAGQ